LNPSNFTAIGFGAGFVGSNSNTIEIGNTSVTYIGGQVGFSSFSDGRIKKDIREDVPGLSFVTKLRPVTYYFDVHKQNEIIYGAADTIDWEGKYDLENIRQSGFIAQEVLQAANELGYDFNGVTVPQNDRGLYSIQYSALIVPLVKAVQEQQSEIELLKQEIEMLKLMLMGR
jgi:trimeric autotransporter adhesin